MRLREHVAGPLFGFGFGAALSALVVAALLGLGACTGDTPSDEVVPCTAGRSEACACPDGRTGAQVCNADGTFGACSCRGTSADDSGSDTTSGSDTASGPDTGSDAATGSGTDSGSGTDADSGTDAESGSDGGLQTVFTLPLNGVCTLDGWCFKLPQSGVANLQHVWGASPTDIWAFGGSNGVGTALHYDGTSWRGLTGLPVAFKNIQGNATNDVWGWDGGSSLMHWDGGQLRIVPIVSSYTLNTFFAGGPTDVWLGGQSGTFRHWDGNGWSTVASGTLLGIMSMAGSGPNDVHALLQDGSLLHWDGIAWSPAGIVPPTGTTTLRVFPGIAGLWADAGSVTHYNGTTWDTVFSSVPAVTDFWMISPTDGFFVGDYPRVGTTENWVLRGGSPSRAYMPPCGPAGVWGQSGYGYVLATWATSSGTGDSRTCPLFSTGLDGFSASTMVGPLGSAGSLGSVVATGTNDLWAVQGNTVLRGDGVNFTTSFTASTTVMLAAGAPTDVWALGTGGIVSHFNGSSWSTQSLGTNVTFSYGRALAANDLWTVGTGASPDIWHWDGSSWTDVRPVPDPLSSGLGNVVWGSGASLYAGSSSIEKWTGAAWTKVFTDPNASDSGQWLDGPAANDLWAYSGSELAHFDGTSWTAVPFSALPDGGWAIPPTVYLATGTPLAISQFHAIAPVVERWTGTSWRDELLGDDSFRPVGFASYGARTWILAKRTVPTGETVLLYRGP